MSSFLPIRLMHDRLQVAKDESDVAAFFALLYLGEMVAKLITATMVAAVADDKDRTRYGLLHRLIRADGIGEWAAVLDEVLTGPAAQFLLPEARQEQRELTQRLASGSWQFNAVVSLRECTSTLSIPSDPVSSTAALRQWFPIFASLRNKTRGHGAPRDSECSEACRSLEKSISLITDNFQLFKRPWAYLHRNLSGKYRVTRLADDTQPFEHLKKESTATLPDGVYVALGTLVPIDLLRTDPDASDFMLPNGQFRSATFEVLSYITGATAHTDGKAYLEPPHPLPPSQTQSLDALDVTGRCFSNVPPKQTGYINRDDLEAQLKEQLMLERHPIVTLTGVGGIGKTSLALTVLHELVQDATIRFDVVMWFSARDIDLLEEGPKRVRPQAISLGDFAEEYATLVNPSRLSDKQFDPIAAFGQGLSGQPVGPALYIFDNFETVVSQEEVFRWIDTYIRPPNKVLITTRFREFASDFPIEVKGMTERQAKTLIATYSRNLGIEGLITSTYTSDLFQESDGHPYVMKIMLGEVAKQGRLVKPERVVAAREEMLTALFERTYASLSPAAQRLFLLMSNWRSVIPELAIEAVILRPSNERMDVRSALDELRRASLLEEIISPHDGENFLNIPLAASSFGKRKLTASPLKAAVEADTRLLRGFGAARKEDVRHGVEARVRRMVSSLARGISDGETTLEESVPTLEFIARKLSGVWLNIADLYQDQRTPDSLEKARECVRRYLESPPTQEGISFIWKRLAELCERTGDYAGEVHALVAMSELADVPLDAISAAANRVNNINFELKSKGQSIFDTDERRILVRRIAQAMERHHDELDAIDCSRLAWLYLHLGDALRARQLAEQGIKIDPDNEYCGRILAQSRH